MVAVSALLMGAGLVLTARIHYFSLIFVTYGVRVGASVDSIYIASIAAVGEWSRR